MIDTVLQRLVLGTASPAWEVRPLGAVSDNYDKYRIPLNNMERSIRQGDYPYCGANGVVDHVNDYKLDGEYILLAEDGGHWGRNEQSSYIMKGKFWVNNHAHILKAKDGLSLNQYLCFALNFLNIDPLIGGDARGKLTQAVMKEIPIPLPPLPEQKNIAAVLSKHLKAVEAQTAIVENLCELKKSMMNRLFTQGLRGEPLKKTEVGMIPKSWAVVTIGNLGEIVTGTTPPTKRKDYYESGGYPFIAPADLGATTQIYTSVKQITQLGLNVSRDLPRHSVCFVCIGSTIGKVGITVQEHSATNQQLNAIVASDKHDPFFITYLLIYHSQRIANYATPSPVPILSKGKFADISVCVSPSKEEQQEIAHALRAIDDNIEIHKAKKSALEDLFKTMLNKMMTGVIRVKNLDIDTREAN